MDGSEVAVEPRAVPADDSQQLSESKDLSTPKSKKPLQLGKSILGRLFSPRRDLHKSLTMDADDRAAGVAYSVDSSGQVNSTTNRLFGMTAMNAGFHRRQRRRGRDPPIFDSQGSSCDDDPSNILTSVLFFSYYKVYLTTTIHGTRES